MSKSQYEIVKKYKKKKKGFSTMKNLLILIVVFFSAISIGYSYWNSTLIIGGTVTGVESIDVGDVYDPDDPEEGTHTYTGTPGSPTVTTEDGEVVEFEFEDTDGTEFGSGTGANEPLETGISAFDGSGFTIHLRFKADLTENNNKYVVTALQETNGKYDGFSVYIYNNGYIRLATYLDRPRSNSTGLLIPNNYTTINNKVISGEREYDMYITYDPKGYKNQFAQIEISITDIATGKYIRNTASGKRIATSLSNATITLGGNGVNSLDDMVSMTVYEFSVTKIN